jgi:hypothetical protein
MPWGQEGRVIRKIPVWLSMELVVSAGISYLPCFISLAEIPSRNAA